MAIQAYQYKGVTFFIEVANDVFIKIEDNFILVYYKYMNKKDRVVNLDDFIDDNTIGPQSIIIQ